MQKTKLGISVGLLGAAVYFTGLFSGYMVAIVLAGYVLLFEDNEWLKKNVVKAIALMVFFDLIAVVFNLLPNAITFINSVVTIFGGKFSIAVLTKAVTAITNGFSIVEKVLFIGLGLKALNQGSISFKPVDKVVNKYME